MAEERRAAISERSIDLAFEVNGRPRSLRIEPRETLAEVLRDRLALTGTKVSCDAQVCGACTVLVDGLAVSACTFLAADAEGRRVRTVEGLAVDGRLTALQQAFIDRAAFQCGFCTSGMLMAATALLEDVPSPTAEQVVHGLEGNLCRCTGYAPIVEAVLEAAAAGDDRAAEGDTP
ncbi:MAG TPA: (2Fe-2S)-binding protein [Candidatus Limnocylindrales bacterium]